MGELIIRGAIALGVVVAVLVLCERFLSWKRGREDAPAGEDKQDRGGDA